MGRKHVSFDGERDSDPIERKREGRQRQNESMKKKKWAILREGTGQRRTGFHAATCSSLQMPGVWKYAPTRASMHVASVMASVPGTLVRCL